jgi:hypothetical protein
MFGFITRQAASVTAPAHHRVPVEPMRAAPQTSGGARQALGVTLVAIGQRVAGEMPAAQASQADGDCA